MSDPRSRLGLLGGVTAVRVGSANEPKVEAVRSAFLTYLPEVVVEGAGVESGVAEQPVGFEEIARGARNRARRALALPGAPPPELGVGIEDGLVELPLGDLAEVVNIGCCCVTDGSWESIGLSSAFAYPADCAQPALEERAPIGEVFDRRWAAYAGERSGRLPSARTSGNIGKLSLGALPRSDYARQAVLCALVRFLHPDLYFPIEAAASGGDR